MATRVPFAFYVDGPDNATSNIKKKQFLATFLPKNVMLLDEGCSAHHVNRAIQKAMTDSKAFVGDVHAVAVTSSTTSHANTLQRALWDLIDTELTISFTRVDPSWAGQQENIVSHTVLKSFDHVRGSLGIGGESLGPGQGEKAARDKVVDLFLFSSQLHQPGAKPVENPLYPPPLQGRSPYPFHAPSTSNPWLPAPPL